MKCLTLSFLIIGCLAAHQAYAQDISPQPLTRADCDKARMAWDANANVCVVASAGSPKATNPVAPSVLINIDKSKQKMTVSVDGVERYDLADLNWSARIRHAVGNLYCQLIE